MPKKSKPGEDDNGEASADPLETDEIETPSATTEPDKPHAERTCPFCKGKAGPADQTATREGTRYFQCSRCSHSWAFQPDRRPVLRR